MYKEKPPQTLPETRPSGRNLGNFHTRAHARKACHNDRLRQPGKTVTGVLL